MSDSKLDTQAGMSTATAYARASEIAYTEAYCQQAFKNLGDCAAKLTITIKELGQEYEYYNKQYAYSATARRVNRYNHKASQLTMVVYFKRRNRFRSV